MFGRITTRLRPFSFADRFWHQQISPKISPLILDSLLRSRLNSVFSDGIIALESFAPDSSSAVVVVAEEVL